MEPHVTALPCSPDSLGQEGTSMVTCTGSLRAEQQSTYVHVPFDMPAGAVRLEVEYAYSARIGAEPKLAGGNTIDLGVMDSRGIDFLAAGFRGWSGSERAAIFIAEDDATPGYIAGPLPPGRWHVMLGLYKVAAEGCEYRVTITIRTEPERQASEFPSLLPGGLPASQPRGIYAPWLAGELHCHSWHSDGDLSPGDLAALGRERGLDFLAITDHNTVAGQYELQRLSDPGLVLVRGVEVTTFQGHLAAWGIRDWLDFRAESADDMAAIVQFARETAALTACNHPKPFGPDWTVREVTGYDCIEVWNGPWQVNNQASLEFWLAQLAQGRRIPAVGGSDFHRKEARGAQLSRDIGAPTTWVWAPGSLTEATILAAIRAGHVSLSANPGGPLLELWCRSLVPDSLPDERHAEMAMQGDLLARPANGLLSIYVRCRHGQGNRLQLMDPQGVLHEQMITDRDTEVATILDIRDSAYVRAELRTLVGNMQALTNPLYLFNYQFPYRR